MVYINSVCPNYFNYKVMPRRIMQINPSEFQESITKELDIIKNRVRNLIGSAHWGEEGRYKEEILKNILKRFLPNNLSVGTGFIVHGNNSENSGSTISTQLDIIIYDNNTPNLFSEGDFIITTEENVKGIIEVKTRVVNANGQKNSIKHVIEKFQQLQSFTKFSETGKNSIFKGLFVYDYDDDIANERIDEVLKISNGMFNHISLGTNYFIRHWNRGARLNVPVDCEGHFYNIYNINDLSFSYFISNLIHITTQKEMEERDWFSFPIPETKEAHRLRSVCL